MLRCWWMFCVVVVVRVEQETPARRFLANVLHAVHWDRTCISKKGCCRLVVQVLSPVFSFFNWTKESFFFFSSPLLFPVAVATAQNILILLDYRWYRYMTRFSCMTPSPPPLLLGGFSCVRPALRDGTSIFFPVVIFWLCSEIILCFFFFFLVSLKSGWDARFACSVFRGLSSWGELNSLGSKAEKLLLY